MLTLKNLGKMLLLTAIPAVLAMGCGRHRRVFKSNCNDGATTIYKRISFTELLNHLKKYDKQYVEVTGKYQEGPEQSVLVNDSLFSDHSLAQSIWIDFNPDCPLYEDGTHIGLFQYNNGQFTQLNNKHMTIKGRVDAHNTGHLNKYKGSIERISFINL